MDIYKWLFGPRGRAALDDADPAAGLLAAYGDQIRATEMAILGAAMMDEGVPVAPLSSRLGGMPWWPAAMNYPTSPSGAPLFLLAQVNFGEAPRLGPFPAEGLLQVFIAADDLYGCNVDDVTRSTGFRCVYHTDLAQPARADLSFLAAIDCNGLLPLDQPLTARGLVFRAGRMTVDVTDYRFERLLPELAGDEDLLEAYVESRATPAIRIGGYPTFTQEDPRRWRDHPKYGHYAAIGDVALLTVDTTDGIMWGDTGVAQFLMHEADLERRDFSKVIYSWDCC